MGNPQQKQQKQQKQRNEKKDFLKNKGLLDGKKEVKRNRDKKKYKKRMYLYEKIIIIIKIFIELIFSNKAVVIKGVVLI